MAEFQNTIDLLGDEAVTKALVEKTITEFNDDVISEVGQYAFYKLAALTSVNMPNVTNVGQNAFYQCANLTSANLPNVTIIGENSFSGCSKLASVNMPNVTAIGNKGFQSCAVKEINLPKLGSVGMSTFGSCQSLESVRLDSATGVSNRGFSGCRKLSSVYCPSLIGLSQDAFADCTSLKILDFSYTGSKNSSFGLNNTCFENSAIETMIFRRENVIKLGTIEAFTGTPFAPGKAGGTFLVRSSLVTTFTSATNWSAVLSGNANNRVLALEDYTIDGTITGEIDWDKLNGGTT